MDLKKRLAELDRLSRRPASPASRPRPMKADAERDGSAAMDALGLANEAGPDGPVWFRDYEDRISAPPSRLPDLGGFFTTRIPAGRSRESILLLDTETTGLAGGTGTLVFVLGCSWWEDDRLLTRQYFLPGPALERPLLASLAALASRFENVVTYNGASFDLPLLRTRALLNRLEDPLRGMAGWDLVVPARRLWRYSLPDCRQQTIETHLAGGPRGGGDIDGGQIPQTWFDFLQTGDVGLLPNVLTHNHRDMVGMATIFTTICGIAEWLADTRSVAGCPRSMAQANGSGAWSLGRICERRGHVRLASAFFRHGWREARQSMSEAGQRRRFRRDAIRNLKRRQEWDLVEELIHDGLQYDQVDSALHIEAAILYEHRLVDRERAFEHAAKAGDTHRMARLRRLLARDAEPSGE